MIFATHYHPLTAEFEGAPEVKLGYMAAAVATSTQASHGLPCITFLYKLLQGVSPESYGLQVPPPPPPECTLFPSSPQGFLGFFCMHVAKHCPDTFQNTWGGRDAGDLQ